MHTRNVRRNLYLSAISSKHRSDIGEREIRRRKGVSVNLRTLPHATPLSIPSYSLVPRKNNYKYQSSKKLKNYIYDQGRDKLVTVTSITILIRAIKLKGEKKVEYR